MATAHQPLDGTYGRFLHTLADAAGAAILPYYRTSIVMEGKSSARFDPVTEADRAGEAAIRRLIEDRHPEHGIIGEEYGRTREDADFVWVIDPIDGTRSFISGQPVWGTLIALLHKGEAILGLNDQPFIGERFVGNGQVALVRKGGLERSMRSRNSRVLADAHVWVASSTALDPALRPAVAALERSVRMLQIGADCYTTAMVADGRIDAVIGSGHYEIYDIAAHVPIVTGAGGYVSALDGRAALQGTDMLASGSATVHAAILELIRAHRVAS